MHTYWFIPHKNQLNFQPELQPCGQWDLNWPPSAMVDLMCSHDPNQHIKRLRLHFVCPFVQMTPLKLSWWMNKLHSGWLVDAPAGVSPSIHLFVLGEIQGLLPAGGNQHWVSISQRRKNLYCFFHHCGIKTPKSKSWIESEQMLVDCRRLNGSLVSFP